MKIITSNTSHGAFKGIVDEINEHRGFFEKNIVLAPDRFTASVERAILSSLKEKSAFDIEVMSFTRLAQKVLDKEVNNCLTPQGAIMLVSQAILNCKSDLTFYGKVAGIDGFAQEVYAVLTALRNSGLSSEDIREKALTFGSSRLGKKLVDIATIYKSYLELLGKVQRSDSTTRLEALAEHFKNDVEFLKENNFYCTDIYDFSAPELEVIKHIALNAKSFTIAFVSGKDNANAHIYPDGGRENVVERIMNICKEANPAPPIFMPDDLLAEPFETISKYLFSYVKPKTPAEVVQNDVQKVKLRVAKNRYDEVLQLVLDINEKVREQGGRYKDIEVFVPDLAGYAPELKSAFVRYGIPFFLDQKELLSEQTLVKYLLLALAVVKSNFRADEVLDFVKNPLFARKLDFGEQKVFAFENYVLKYGLSYLSDGSFKFFEPHDKEHHYYPPNFKDTDVDKAMQKVLTAEENKVPKDVFDMVKKVLEPITSVVGKVADEKKLADFVEGCRAFLDAAKDDWKEHVKQLESLSKYYEKAAEQVEKKLNGTLDEIKEVLGDHKKTIADFVLLFDTMIESQKIALVPTYLDCVFVGTSGSRFMGLGDVYVLGATIDNLPTQNAGGTIITAKDEETLDALQCETGDKKPKTDDKASKRIKITPTTAQKNYTAKYEICDLMKKPRGKLVISYAESLDGNSCRRSAVIDELQQMLQKNGNPLDVEPIDFERIVDSAYEEGCDQVVKSLFATKQASFHESLRRVFTTNENSSDKILYDSAVATIDDATQKAQFSALDEEAKNVASKQLEKISVSQIETFYSCPYKYYLGYRLGLKERKKGEFLNTDNGSILHSVLEQLFKDVRDEKVVAGKITDKALDKKVDAYFEIAIKDMQYLLQKEHALRMLDKLKAECKVRAKEMLELVSRSKFKPYLLEARIGDKKDCDCLGEFEIALSARRKVSVSGYVDRVDKWKNGEKSMFTIIDYKTFKGIDLKLADVYFGKHVQLYVYMNAVEQNEHMAPAGVFYLPLYESFEKDDNKPRPRYRFVGHALDDDKVIEAMDSLSATDPKKALPPFTDSGTKGNAASYRFLPPENIKAVGDYALKIVAKGVETIEKGFIKATPADGNTCSRCQFQEVCPYVKTDARDTSNVGIDAFV